MAKKYEDMTDAEKKVANEAAAQRREEERRAKEKADRVETIALLEKQLKLEEAIGDVRDAAHSKQKLVVNLLEQAADFENDKAFALKTANELNQMSVQEQLNYNSAKAEQQRKLDEIVEKLKEQGIEVEAQLGKFEDIKKNLEEQRKIQDKMEKWAGKYESLIGGIASKIGIGNSSIVAFAKKWGDVANEISTSEEAAQEFSKQIKQTFSVANIAGSLLESFIGMAVAIDNTSASLSAATGTADKFRDNITTISTKGLSMGRTLESTSEAIKVLNSGLIGFNTLSKTSLDSLGGLAADLKRLGVNGEDFSKSLNVMTTSMGVSHEVAADLTKEIAMMGTDIGISSQKMMSDFSAASSVLAVHGKKSIDVFKNLASAARNSGVEMSELLSIAGKFDTFSDAAEATGKLNAILGSQMSAVDMLNMKEDERVETIIRSIKSQGIAFGQMDRFTQKAIAQAAGISDMAKANQIFGMSLNEYKKSQAEMKRQENIQRKFEEAVKATIPIQEKFANAIKSIASNEGFLNFLMLGIDMLESIATGISYAMEYTDGWAGVLVFAIAGLAAFVTVLGPAIGMMYSAVMALKATGDETEKTGKKMGKGAGDFFKNLGKGAKKGAAGIAVITLAVIGIAFAFKMAAEGAAVIANSFKGIGDAGWPAAAAIVGMTVALAAMVVALAYMSGAAPAILPIVGIVIALALAFGGIAFAASKVIDSIKDMSAGITGAITSMSDALTNASVIADIISNASDKLQGLGESQKLELKSTLESMAVITSGGRYIPQQTSTAMSRLSPSVTYNPASITNNLELGNLKLVLADGTQLDAYIAHSVTKKYW